MQDQVSPLWRRELGAVETDGRKRNGEGSLVNSEQNEEG